ncbi:MAG: hypothetical protein L0I24_00240 [Pseudonocardia sp.]|nr:hypothetical protein [Pseudonocardia sp.]
MTTGSYVPPGSLVPLFAAPPLVREAIQGRLTAWNSVTRANVVEVLGEDRVNLPVLMSAEATLSAGQTVLLIPLGPSHIIAGRIRVP